MKEKKPEAKKESIPITCGAVISEPGSTKKYRTGEWRTYIPIIDQSKCTKCGQCWMVCPDAAIFKDKNGNMQINYLYCKGCLLCEKTCPLKVITHKVEEK